MFDSVYNFIETHHLWGPVWFLCFFAILFVISYVVSIIRAVFNRLRFCAKLRKSGVRLFPAHGMWMLGGIYGSGCDFYVHSGDTLLAVKLIGRLWSGTEYALTSRKMWRKQTNVVIPIRGMWVIPCGFKNLRVPDYDFRRNLSKLPAELRSLPIVDTLVFQPFPFKLTPKEYAYEQMHGRLVLSGSDLMNIAQYGVMPPHAVGNIFESKISDSINEIIFSQSLKGL